MLTHRTEIRVRYSETDKMQFVHNAKYIEYFEIARTEMLRHYNLPYKVIEDNGYDMPVTETFIKYRAPAYYDELLVVETKAAEFLSPRVRIDYKVLRKDDEQLLAEGYTILAFVNRKTKKISRPPEFYIKAIEKYFEKQDA